MAPKPHTQKTGRRFEPNHLLTFWKLLELFRILNACQFPGLSHTDSALFLPQRCALPSILRSTVYFTCLGKLTLKMSWAEPRDKNGGLQTNESTEDGFLFDLVSVLLYIHVTWYLPSGGWLLVLTKYLSCRLTEAPKRGILKWGLAGSWTGSSAAHITKLMEAAPSASQCPCNCGLASVPAADLCGSPDLFCFVFLKNPFLGFQWHPSLRKM